MNRFTDKFTESAKELIERAKVIAVENGSKYVGSEHLLLGMLETENSNAARLLYTKGITLEGVKKQTDAFLRGESMAKTWCPELTPMSRIILKGAEKIAEQSCHLLIGSEHILISILEQRECVAVKILQNLNLSVSEIKASLYNSEVCFHKSDKKSEYPLKKSSSFIEKYGKNLCSAALKGQLDPVFARDNEINRLIAILCRRTKCNPCLVGEPGVGKTAIVEGLAIRIAEGNVPNELINKEIVSVELSSMIAGAKYRGDFEERMKGILDELKNNSDIIMFIDEIHTIVGAGSAEGAMDAANIIKPALARGEIRVIGATTYNEYIKHIEKDAALERRFQHLYVCEPTEEDAKTMIMGIIDKYKKHHGVNITEKAIEHAINLSALYINDKYLPDKAIDLIDEACANKRLAAGKFSFDHPRIEERLELLEREKELKVQNCNFKQAAEIYEKQIMLINNDKQDDHQDNMPEIEVDDIVDVISVKTGIPIRPDGSLEGLKNLQIKLKEKIMGQDKAIERIVCSIRRGMTVFRSKRKPIASFLFTGSSGVGKTELSVCIANELFNREGGFLRLDMSEYMEQHSVAKLIGSPPGYIGYDDGGILSKHVRRHPYTVVLFDEMEKAHKEVYNILLQILDAGRLTDAHARTVDFSNTVIIMTSNAGNNDSFKKVRGFFNYGEDYCDGKNECGKFKDTLKNTFSKEFLNRIDEIIPFSDLGRDVFIDIILKYLEETADKAETAGIEVEYEEKVAYLLADRVAGEGEGARSICRIVQREIENRLANAVVDGEIKAPCIVRFTVSDNNIILSIKDSVLNGV